MASFQRDYDLCKTLGYAIPSSVKTDLEVSKQYLTNAQGYLRRSGIFPPNMKNAVAQLNAALKTASFAHETLLLEKAQYDIEKYRKGNTIITVVDNEGNPVPDCDISYEQISHDFLFGAFLIVHHDGTMKYADALKKVGINHTYHWHVWKSAEPQPGIYEWAGNDWDIDATLAEGLSTEGDAFVAMYRPPGDDSFTPYYWDNMTIDQLKENVYNHMVQVTKRYGKILGSYGTVEMNCPWQSLNLTWNQKLDVMKAFADGVKATDPSAKIQHLSNASMLEFTVPRAEDLNEIANKGIPFYEFLSLLREL